MQSNAAHILSESAGCYIQKPLHQARAHNCKQETEHTLMMAFLPMRDLRPMMAFSTLHSSRKAPWLTMASAILECTILAGGRNRGEV